MPLEKVLMSRNVTDCHIAAEGLNIGNPEPSTRMAEELKGLETARIAWIRAHAAHQAFVLRMEEGR